MVFFDHIVKRRINFTISKEEGIDFDPSFRNDEFKPSMTKKGLCQAINADNYDLTFESKDNTIERLNELLTIPNFFEELSKMKSNISFSQDIMDLEKETRQYRNMNFSSLKPGQKLKIKRLNRFLLEEVYEQYTPKLFQIKETSTDESAFTNDDEADTIVDTIKGKESSPETILLYRELKQVVIWTILEFHSTARLYILLKLRNCTNKKIKKVFNVEHTSIIRRKSYNYDMDMLKKK